MSSGRGQDVGRAQWPGRAEGPYGATITCSSLPLGENQKGEKGENSWLQVKTILYPNKERRRKRKPKKSK